MNAKHLTWLSIAVIALLAALLLSACQPQTVEVIKTVEVITTELVEGTPVVSTVVTVATPGPAYPAPGGVQGIPPPASPRMVIKDAELELLVSDTDRANDQVTQMAADYGGYIISSQTWYSGPYLYATLRLAVPSDSFETALNYLRHLGVSVLRENASGQDVTAEYVDLQSRLGNLQATAARVRLFLDEAKTVEEALLVNQELSTLEQQIEQIEGQMNYYEGRSSYSTVTVSLTPQQPTPTPTPQSDWNPGATFQDASQALVRLSQGTVDLLIWALILGGPLVLALLLLVTAARLVRRRFQK